jgi:iron complex transport system substrate-binding protein
MGIRLKSGAVPAAVILSPKGDFIAKTTVGQYQWEGVMTKESQKTSLSHSFNHPLSGGKVMIYRLIFALPLFFFACAPKGTTHSTIPSVADSTYRPVYAQGFYMEYYPGFKLVKIHNPFDNSRDTLVLCIQTDSLFDIAKIKAHEHLWCNNQSWVALSSTHISSANLLNAKSRLVGVAEPEYISDTFVHQGLNNHTIRNVGMAMSPDLEVLLQLNPGFVMVSPFANISYSALSNAGLTVIPNASYLENTPLGRAEWVVFVASLFGEEQQAIELFDGISRRYEHLKSITQSVEKHPTVLTGHLYMGVWNASQGNNYMASYFKDAGAEYIYKDSPGTGTLSLDYETVYRDGAFADYWVLMVNYPGNFSYEAITQMDSRYGDFKAFQSKKVIFTNTNHSLFFEKAEQEPDVVLADLINAFHPGLLNNHHPIYFESLK